MTAIPASLIWLIAERALDAIAVGIERQAVRTAIEESISPEDIPETLRQMRNEAIVAAQAEIDKE